MKIDYSRFFNKLKENHLTQKEFKEKANIASSTMSKLINNENMTTDIICRICDFFHCMPDEIMEWIPDSDYERKQQEKANVKAQIAELQAKLKQM